MDILKASLETVCRFCRAHKEVLRSLTLADPALLRDVQSHEADMRTVNPFKDIQSGLTGIPLFSELYEMVSVTFKGTAYRAGMTVFLSYDPDGEPQFGLIKSILVLNQTSHTPTIKLVVQKWKTKWFDRHFFAYSVIPTHVLAAVDVRELLDHHPLHAVKSFSEHDDSLYIALRYRLF